MIKNFKEFIYEAYHDENDDIKLMIDDMFLEYMDKYNLYNVLDNNLSDDQKKSKSGYYSISKVKSILFKVDGFPKNSAGYQVKLYLPNYKDIKQELHNDMFSFINRVCKSFKFKFDTFHDSYNQNILIMSFYNEL